MVGKLGTIRFVIGCIDESEVKVKLVARRHAPKQKPSKPRKVGGPGDYEAELVRLCKGNRREAERLIREQMERSPEMSRQGAALALVTRLRHERSPYPPPL